MHGIGPALPEQNPHRVSLPSPIHFLTVETEGRWQRPFGDR